MKRKYENFEQGVPYIKSKTDPSVRIIVVIPSFDEKDLEKTILSLLKADNPEEGSVEIIVLINEAENTSKELIEFHDQQFDYLSNKYLEQKGNKFVYPLRAKKLKLKHAGVGLARKIGMDEAAYRFQSIRYDDGIIACLDADTLVEKNYFIELQKAYQEDKNLQAASVFFEHDLDDNNSNEEKMAIVQYELHLRYHINMQRFIGLPFAYHTIGSTMTVRQSAYLAHFGMNKKKAGEDFYFLHKFIKTGHYREISSSTVFPSSRYSDRVPFGTGRMVEKLSKGSESLMTYHPKSYASIAILSENLKEIYLGKKNVYDRLPPELLDFFGTRLNHQVEEIKKHTADYSAFEKRFYRWFDAFFLIKCLHFFRDHHYSNIPINEAIETLFKKLSVKPEESLQENLIQLREYDRLNPYVIRY